MHRILFEWSGVMHRFIYHSCLHFIRTKAAMQVLNKTNEDIIKGYFDAKQTEINPSVNYVNTNRNTLNRLIEFHNNKFFLKMNREDIISYLNSTRKSEDVPFTQMDWNI